ADDRVVLHREDGRGKCGHLGESPFSRRLGPTKKAGVLEPVASKPRPRTSATGLMVADVATLTSVRTFFEERGAGPVVVLIHGLGGSTAIWRRVVRPLADDFRVLAYDLRGLGRSETPPPPYGLDDLVADLDALLDGLGVEQATLVGHSLGGAVAFA